MTRLALFLLVGGAAAFFNVDMLKSRVRVGQKAPEWEVEIHTGQLLSTEFLAGQPYVLWFYPTAGESLAITEALSFSALFDDFKRMGYPRVFGVSTDSVEVNKAFHDKYELPFALCCDYDKVLTKAFDGCKPSKDATDFCAMAIPACVVVDGDGMIMSYEYPFDPRLGPRNLLNSLTPRVGPTSLKAPKSN
ncbi:thioredoxin-like protein [Pelagophyceae sp. CCMP2097]|nr:thioredoxin-like protein [Pelagophyceae sp. CCMP2097]|mmetsp:Transcript_11954/g.42269  ORF Transcript_11954/g.42269 Transcript_11954/m.42269 type:complete len:191 (-) Transcript_11954:176-748(-)